MKKEALYAAFEALDVESKAISSIKDYLDISAFGFAVDALASCNKVISCASGSSGIAAKKLAHSLCCIELNALCICPLVKRSTVD
ncbi:MAG: hypothetical protein ACYCX4_18020 [Bacillota bacterium]